MSIHDNFDMKCKVCTEESTLPLCRSCEKQMPSLEELALNLKQGFRWLTIREFHTNAITQTNEPRLNHLGRSNGAFKDYLENLASDIQNDIATFNKD